MSKTRENKAKRTVEAGLDSAKENKAKELRTIFKRTVEVGLDPAKAMNVNLEDIIQIDRNRTVAFCVTKLVYPLSNNPNSFLAFTKDGRVKLVTESKGEMDTFRPIGPDELLEKVAKVPSYYKS